MFQERPHLNAFTPVQPVASPKNKYVILGQFSAHSCAPPFARQMAAQLVEGGNVVVTTSIAPSPARVPLRFRTRRLWKKTLSSANRMTSAPFTAIIYPAGLGFDAIHKPRWRSRRMEEWRRFKLAVTIALRAKECFLVLDFTRTRQAPLWFSLLLGLTLRVLPPRTTRILWAKDSSLELIKRLTGCATPPLPVTKNIVHIRGITQGQSGLALNARMSVDAFALADIPTNMGKNPASRRLERPVILHHINADQIPRQVHATDSSVKIGFLLWELETLPKSHLQAGKLLDEVWVPSSYVQKIYQRAYDCNVINIGKGLMLPEVRAMDLRAYGIGSEHHVVLMCFDPHSSVERKNPLAAVRAFLAAFPDDPNARMIVKMTPIEPSHWGDPNGQMATIRSLARKDSRIMIYNRMLPFTTFLSLIKRADCVVSSHRAEGFGYIPAYAHWYARPVIATDYSGTTDICTEKTSHLVDYKLIRARPGETIASLENAYWADINVETLANTLRYVRANPDKAHTKALCGQKLLRTQYTPAKQAQRYLDRFIALGLIEN